MIVKEVDVDNEQKDMSLSPLRGDSEDRDLTGIVESKKLTITRSFSKALQEREQEPYEDELFKNCMRSRGNSWETGESKDSANFDKTR